MINAINNYFKIDTKNTSYIIKISKFNHILNCFYGGRIEDQESYYFAEEKYGAPSGTATNYKEEDYNYVLDALSLEVSSPLKGDYKEPSIIIDNGNDFILDLVYQGYTINKEFTKLTALPSPHGELEELVIHTKDLVRDINVDLYYVVDYENDVILRRTLIKNNTKSPIILNKVMSMQLEMVGKNFDILSLYGGRGF